jgi:molybdopterin molybdotransferase
MAALEAAPEMERQSLIGLDRALEIVRGVRVHAREETLLLENALNRVLAREVLSPIDSPPFDKSAMDGFAVGAEEDSVELTIVDTIAAGGQPGRPVGRGECARIMTGAMLPPGTGRVIRREYVREEPGRIRVLTAEAGSNVIGRGASIRAGGHVLSPKVIGPQDVGILAASGIDRVTVAVPPRVAVICTGPEVRPAGGPLGNGEIYDSNGPQLRAQLIAMGCPASVRSGVEDRPAPLARAIDEALGSCDVLLLTGGVSAGDFDYVPACLEELGAEILFHRVSVKPGKPTLFALRGDQQVFGLPGNPVSTFLIFEVFVKPFLFRRMGLEWAPTVFRGTLGQAVRRSQAERTEFLPVRVRQGVVQAVPYHGSAHLNALAEADGFIRMEIGVQEIPQGTQVDVRPI